MNQELSFGAFVRQHRREMDLTQEELARRVGCAAITLRKIEADDLRASVQIAERLAMALAIPLEERSEFVRWARAVRPASSELPPITPPPSIEEIGREDLTGRAIRGYALAERIGMGGMGSVYRAVQPHVEREVAVKIILPAFANHPDFIRRFETEAQLVARLEHPHIVPLYDYWREPGVAYLVMRLLRGGNIQNLLGQGALSIEMTTRMLEQICLALNAAHRIGVIHRDLKPANVLLDEDSNAYLADFGIAKNLGDPDLENQTQLDAMIGSPQYMSPEQIRSLSVRPQTDIYCLGVMLYEMLTGSLPFTGPTPFDMIQQHINTPLPPLSAHRSGLPAALDAVITRATAKDPQDRYVDTLSFFQGFRLAVGGMVNVQAVAVSYETEEESNLEIVNPFKGLRAFGEADAENFFGRETLVQQLLARLGEGGDLRRFLTVIGPSGSGKSSVVRAGLIPALRRGGLPGSENWFVVDMLPGKHPFEELEASLLRVAVNPPESLLSQLKDGNRGLLRAVHRILPADESVELVLLIDQFEEVFTLVEDELERTLLLESLAAAVLDESSRLHVIITLRADFTDKPLRYMDFGELINRRFEFVLPLTTDEVERAVAGPAQRAGLRLEKGLVSTIIREAGNQPGTLPLLQHALSELFEKREGRMLTNKAYREIGGVVGALGRSAEMVFGNLDQAGQSAARQLFLRLVTLGEGTEDTRRRALRVEIGALHDEQQAALQHVIEAFGNARLLSFDHDPLTRGATIEVAHEALLREWTRLREWLDESRADVRLQRQLATAAQEWQNAGHDLSFLMTGSRLEQFEGWSATTTIALTQTEQSYLEASITERDRRDSEEQTRGQRELKAAQKLAETEKQAVVNLRGRNRIITTIGIVAVVLAVLAGMFGLSSSQNAQQALNAQVTSQADVQSRATAESNALAERNIAQQQSLIASVRELSSEANLNLDIDPERSLLLALQAVNKTYAMDHTVLPEAENALHRAIQSSRVELTLRDNADAFWNAVFSPDGSQIATSNASGMVKIWDAATGKEMLAIQASTEGGVGGVVFSPDGKLLATASDDKIARVWEAATGKELLAFKGHMDYVQSIVFSPDGTRLASMSFGGKVIIWEVATGTELVTMQEAGLLLPQALAFSADGTRLATGVAAENSLEGWATIWDAATGEKLISLPKQNAVVRSVTFSPDSTSLVTTGDDRTAKIWSVKDGQLLWTLLGHTDNVGDAAFSPNGTRLATASWDRQVIVWDITTGQELFALAGHSSIVNSVAFSPDGVRVITSGDDKTTRVWNVSSSREVLTLVNGPAIKAQEGARLAYSPEGTGLAVAAAYSDPTAKIWDMTTGKLLFSLTGHTDAVNFITYNTDGTQIATTSRDGTAKVWDALSGREVLTLSGHDDWVMGVAFSPDGSRLATAGFDSTAKIWDTETGKVLRTLTGHKDSLLSVAFNPDGSRIATSSFDGTAIVWDAVTGKPLFTLAGHTFAVRRVIFSPDATRLATASFDGSAKLWDASSGKELLTLSGHTASLFDITFSPDGKLIATASGDRTAKVWVAQTGAQLFTLYAPDGVTSVAFGPNGSQLAIAGRDGTTRIYLVRIEDLIALAKQRVTRSLTPEECQQYLHVAICPAQ
jgi:WD40 repeat protein/transcriptional regulator with XRE-family HTH domain